MRHNIGDAQQRKMSMPAFTESTLPMKHFDPRLTGFYQETLVVNKTNRAIAILTRLGEERIIPPSIPVTTSNHSVIVYHRSTVDQRTHPNNNSDEKAIETRKFVIPDAELDKEPVFLSALDIAVCTEVQLGHVTHPGVAASYHDSLQQAKAELIKSDGAITTRIFANDPTGTHRQLHWHFLGTTYEIPVTQYPDGYSSVTIVVSQDGRELVSKTFEFEEFCKDSGFVEFSSGFVLHASYRADTLQLGLMAVQKRANGSNVDVEAIVTEAQRTVRDEMAKLTVTHRLSLLSQF